MEGNKDFKQYMIQQQRIIQKQQEQIQSLLQSQQKEDLNKASQEPYRKKKEHKLKIDPYKILGISKEDSFDVKKLKKSYLKQAQKTHPDKNKGIDKQFKLVTLAYKVLQKRIDSKETDKIHSDLKDGSIEFIKEQSTSEKKNINMKDFNVKLFNQIYEENKLEDNFNDTGYGDWMKKEDNTEQVKMDGYNKDKFNSEFQKLKQKQKGSQLQEYSEPKELVCSRNIDSLCNLGSSKVESYTGETNGLQFRDLREAFEEPTLIDINNVDISNRNSNIKDYNRERSNISYKLSDMDLRNQALRQENEKINEIKRIQRLKERDQKGFNQYERIHKRLLG